MTNMVFPHRTMIKVEKADSSNPYLLQLSGEKKLPEGTVAIVHEQTHGRGIGENMWESEPGKNLTFSIILYPVFLKGTLQFGLSKVISLAVYDFISQYVPDASVKWPNDVYIGDKKITGILIENFIEGAYLTKSVAGIGININQEKFTGNAPNPVSLKQITGKTFDLDTAMDQVLECIAFRYHQLKEDTNCLSADYLKQMYRFNHLSLFSAENKTFKARITGVNKYGMLETISTENERKTFGFKEVEYL
ncbi:MAG: biotin--[acetyl-CoA-carboxylase] ligase [Bacteroidales bacterium]|nr:biotin--[acetyl-CoA-carboxylase] ligase [Bacteroidales bacterium]